MKKINLTELLEQFNKQYNILYTAEKPVKGYKMAVKKFDNLLKTEREFIQEFAAFRKDIIVSDREAAAFVFALQELKAI